MTKDELMKRLVKIDGTPYRTPVAPRDSVRREFNKIEQAEDDESGFESFFDFENEISQITPARDQLSNSEDKKADVEPVSSFLIIEEDLDAKSGNEESFLVFEEDVLETTIYEDNKEETIVETNNASLELNLEAVTEIEKLEDDIMVKSDLKITNQNNSVINFKLCKYVKDDGESCKRQAPKNAEYCSSHRKILAKQTE